MLVIGENINATNKAVGEAITHRNTKFLEELAKAQMWERAPLLLSEKWPI